MTSLRTLCGYTQIEAETELGGYENLSVQRVGGRVHQRIPNWKGCARKRV
jgi:hypothetical protein